MHLGIDASNIREDGGINYLMDFLRNMRLKDYSFESVMMVFELALQTERHWRNLNGAQLLAHMIRGVVLTDGVMKKAA